MKIAVNTRFLMKNYLEGYGNFIYEIFKQISEKHTEVEFIFIFDRPYDQKFIFGTNIKPVVIGPKARHPLLWRIWYDIRIPQILKKNKIDLFVSCDGMCSLNTNVPQCIVVHDLAFLHYPAGSKKSHLSFFKKFTPKFISKAQSVITVSEFSKNDIIKNYQTEPNKIKVVYNGVREIFYPLSHESRELVRKKYSDSKEYFICVGSIHPRKNLINLLKAFSVFKKRMQSGMKLMIVGRLAWKYDSFLSSLENYKYKSDVILSGFVEDAELGNLIGAAYAMVYPSLFEGFGVPVLEALKCNVPVITSSGSAMEEVTKGKALYVDENSYSDIAEKMMILYKDENLRKKLIGEGGDIAKQYNWDKAAKEFWDCMMNIIDNQSAVSK